MRSLSCVGIMRSNGFVPMLHNTRHTGPLPRVE